MPIWVLIWVPIGVPVWVPVWVPVQVPTPSPPGGYWVTSTISVTMVSVTSVTSVTSRALRGCHERGPRGALGGVQAAAPSSPFGLTNHAALPSCSERPPSPIGLSERLRRGSAAPQPFSAGAFQGWLSAPTPPCDPPSVGCGSGGRRLFRPRQPGRLTELPMELRGCAHIPACKESG